MGGRKGAIRLGSLQIRLHRGYDAQQPGIRHLTLRSQSPAHAGPRRRGPRSPGCGRIASHRQQGAEIVLGHRPGRDRGRCSARAPAVPFRVRAPAELFRPARRRGTSVDGRSRVRSRRDGDPLRDRDRRRIDQHDDAGSFVPPRGTGQSPVGERAGCGRGRRPALEFAARATQATHTGFTAPPKAPGRAMAERPPASAVTTMTRSPLERARRFARSRSRAGRQAPAAPRRRRPRLGRTGRSRSGSRASSRRRSVATTPPPRSPHPRADMALRVAPPLGSRAKASASTARGSTAPFQ